MKLLELFYYFLAWRIILFVIIFLAIPVIPLQFDFLGGEIANYLAKPHIWAFANFDGEHYMQIARDGYLSHTFFYFPAFPLTISLISNLFGRNLIDFLYSGLLVSNLAFLFALFGFSKLVSLEFTKNISRTSILLLLFYPTSFFFGAYYTESLFLAFSVWSIYLFKQDKFLLGGTIAAFASATRIFGIAIIAFYLTQIFLKYKKDKTVNRQALLSALIAPIGLLIFIFYQKYKTGNYLTFIHNLEIFGEQRADNLVFFPQVFFRYVFKIFPSINLDYFPGTYAIFLEFTIALLFLIIIAWMLLNKWYGYGVYSLSIYIISTLSGSFSSFPRYSLVIFPAFIVMAVVVNKISSIYRFTIYSVLGLLLVVTMSLFARAYWIS